MSINERQANSEKQNGCYLVFGYCFLEKLNTRTGNTGLDET